MLKTCHWCASTILSLACVSAKSWLLIGWVQVWNILGALHDVDRLRPSVDPFHGWSDCLSKPNALGVGPVCLENHPFDAGLRHGGPISMDSGNS